MTLYYQLDNKMGLLVAKVAQKTLTFQLHLAAILNSAL